MLGSELGLGVRARVDLTLALVRTLSSAPAEPEEEGADDLQRRRVALGRDGARVRVMARVKGRVRARGRVRVRVRVRARVRVRDGSRPCSTER